MIVTDDLRALLASAETDGTRARFPQPLDRNTYARLNKVLVGAGGWWSRRDNAHVFPTAAADVLDQMILTGQITTARDMGHFPTPPPVIARLLAAAELRPGMLVLEPSAGTGELVAAIAAAGAMVDAIEVDAERFKVMLTRGVARRRVLDDFLSVPATWMESYDRVVMNPPFARQADIAHVLHALEFLRPGGRPGVGDVRWRHLPSGTSGGVPGPGCPGGRDDRGTAAGLVRARHVGAHRHGGDPGMSFERCNSGWWKGTRRVAWCFYPAGHHLEPGNESHHNGTRTWRTFDNRWRTYTTEEMVEKLRVLTVRPPWAWAVAWAGKDVENRPAATNYRGLAIILAGKSEDPDFDSEAVASPRHPQMQRLWLAATDSRLTGEQVVAADEAWLARGQALCVVRITDSHRAEPGCCDSPWAEYDTGWPFHWCLADVQRLSPLLSARGNLGLPKPDPDLADAVGAQLAA